MVDAVALTRAAICLQVGVVVVTVANLQCTGPSRRPSSRVTGPRAAGRLADGRLAPDGSKAPGATISPVALERALAGYQARLAALVDRADLADSLCFGWFDRPYQRATLACAVKALAVMERESHLRQSANGAMGDDQLHSMLRWLDDALDRARAEPTAADFLPNRMVIQPAAYGPGGDGPALFGFVDRASFTRQDEWFGDLDLLAGCGFRVYARPPRFAGSPQIRRTERQRAAALGLFETRILEPDEAPDPQYYPLRPGRLSDFLQKSWTGYESMGKGAIALIDPSDGETWAESVARRALYRGVTQGDRPVAYGWGWPVMGSSGPYLTKQVRAAMWVQVCEGQQLALLEGWRDLRDGSRLPYPALTVVPQCMETVAHTALDVLRHARFLQGMGLDNSLVIFIDESAIDPDDPNRWSPAFSRFATALHERQIPFDLLPRAFAADPQRWAEYELAVTLPSLAVEPGASSGRVDVYARGQAIDVDRPAEVSHSGWAPDRFADWVDGLLRERARAMRVVVVNADGRPGCASDVYVRTARDPNGSLRVALVNLSSQPRSVMLRSAGGSKLGSFVDVLAPGGDEKASAPIELAAWQVRLLVSREAIASREE